MAHSPHANGCSDARAEGSPVTERWRPVIRVVVVERRAAAHDIRRRIRWRTWWIGYVSDGTPSTTASPFGRADPACPGTTGVANSLSSSLWPVAGRSVDVDALAGSPRPFTSPPCPSIPTSGPCLKATTRSVIRPPYVTQANGVDSWAGPAWRCTRLEADDTCDGNQHLVPTTIFSVE